jgi:Protein of unknown function (DUF4232)
MTPTANFRRASLTGATLAVAAVLATGCNSPSSGSASVGASVSAGASSVSVAASGAAAAAGGTATAAADGQATAPAATAPAAAGSAGVAACTAADLRIAPSGSAGGGTPGSYYSFIDFTNTSSTSCTLYGYPGVSLTAASGAQIGPAATRDATTAAATVTLAPGAIANAELRMTDPAVYATSQCKPTTSSYLKVYPPNQTTPVQVSFKADTCANSSIKMLSIHVVTAGATSAS